MNHTNTLPKPAFVSRPPHPQDCAILPKRGRRPSPNSPTQSLFNQNTISMNFDSRLDVAHRSAFFVTLRHSQILGYSTTHHKFEVSTVILSLMLTNLVFTTQKNQSMPSRFEGKVFNLSECAKKLTLEPQRRRTSRREVPARSFPRRHHRPRCRRRQCSRPSANRFTSTRASRRRSRKTTQRSPRSRSQTASPQAPALNMATSRQR